MTKKNVIKMILLQFGYKNINIETFWTGTGEGAYPNRLGYIVDADKGYDNDGVYLESNDFHETIMDLFKKIIGSGICEDDVRYIAEDVFNSLK